MSLVVITDLHISASRPAGRLGDFASDVDIKLREVIDIVHEVEAEAVLCAGDVFHHPVPALSAVDRFIDFLDLLTTLYYNGVSPRFIAIPGSHDLIGNNLDALNRTTIGLLSRLGKIELLSSVTDSVIDVGGFSVGIPGDVAHDIELVHDSILPKPDLFGEFTLTGEYNTGSKIVVVGHVHGGYPLETIGATTFVCPGSIVRTMAQQSELTRRPRLAIIHEDYSVEWRELTSAKSGNEVLAPPVVSPEVDFAGIVQEWANVSIEEVDAETLLREVAVQEQAPEKVVEYALAMLSIAML